jgi:RNA polymerase sigma-70 factor (ECF subfamily)
MLPGVKRDSGSATALGPADEADLIERCRAHERSAHDELYHRFRRQVAGNLYRVLGDRTDLDDLVQEVFVIAFRGLDRFRGDARLSTWLYRICVNVALGRIRTRRRRPSAVSIDLDAAAPDPSLTDRPETPERALERSQDRARVYRALELLAPKKRVVHYLHEIEELNFGLSLLLFDFLWSVIGFTGLRGFFSAGGFCPGVWAGALVPPATGSMTRGAGEAPGGDDE